MITGRVKNKTRNLYAPRTERAGEDRAKGSRTGSRCLRNSDTGEVRIRNAMWHVVEGKTGLFILNDRARVEQSKMMRQLRR
jgi:hypothetical protein